MSWEFRPHPSPKPGLGLARMLPNDALIIQAHMPGVGALVHKVLAAFIIIHSLIFATKFLASKLLTKVESILNQNESQTLPAIPAK